VCITSVEFVMTARTVTALALVAFTAVAAGCESKKSANPLSPSVAGPIPGVEISAPKPLEPGSGWEVSHDKQPLTLLIENPASNGQRPVTLEVEVAADQGFSTKVFAKAGIQQGTNGRTSLVLPEKLTSDRTYFWRAKGQDGANHGPWSGAVQFSIFTPAALGAPAPTSPIGGATVGDLQPTFRFRNASRSGPVGAITYMIEISLNTAFTQVVASYAYGERGGPGGETSAEAVADLPGSATLFWRVRAWDGTLNGAWSATQHFKTPAGPAAPPPGGGGGGGSPGNCASRNGDFIVNCIAQKYASYRRPVGSLAQRQANMRFLRDRIIEAGLCGGLNLGWNLKRGGPELSIDFIAERRGGLTYGYDIARDYDNFRSEMQLYWGGDGPGSHFKEYPKPSCN
jgi:hypothetical protein